jgi:hypothetical protein
MRTLLEIEPRTPISSLPFTIATSGAYYLAGNLTGTNGITIAADNVDLDLLGFTLKGLGGTNNGISVPGNQQNVAIHNGNVVSWGGFGVNASNVSNGKLDRLRLSGNGKGGAILGAGGVVSLCEATANSGDGIRTGDGATVRDCVARTNAIHTIDHGGSGIVCGSSALVTGCFATYNFDYGIQVGNNSTVSGSSANRNGWEPSFLGPNHWGAGIRAADGCTILGCTATANDDHFWDAFGISVVNGCTIRDCTVVSNAVGIRSGNDCNIQACLVAYNTSDGMTIGGNCTVRDTTSNLSGYTDISMLNECRIEGNAFLGSVHVQAVGMGSRNVFFHNKLTANGVHDGILEGGFNNLIGTIEDATSLNTNKNPHANITP